MLADLLQILPCPHDEKFECYYPKHCNFKDQHDDLCTGVSVSCQGLSLLKTSLNNTVVFKSKVLIFCL